MKLSNVKVEENLMTFILKDSSAAYANAIRRALMEEVPVMAITEVEIFDNTTCLFDEYIAHRLGLIPLTTDLKNYKLPENCCGGNCSNCSTSFKLEAKGPATVYTKELIPTDKEVKPVYDNIPIIKLTENQILKLQAKANLGFGKQHARWQPCVASYKYLPDIEIKNVKDAEKIIAACPVKILEKKSGGIKVSEPEKCIECMECVEASGNDGTIKIGHDNTTFLFKVESFENMKPKELLQAALKTIEEKAESLEKQIKEKDKQK